MDNDDAAGELTSLTQWLAGRGLPGVYATLLFENGFEDIDTIRLASSSDLEDIGMKKGHALKLVKEAAVKGDDDG